MNKSPMKTDTEFADKVFAKDKVNESLRKRGEHTEGKLRGTKNTSVYGGVEVGGNNRMIDIQD